MRSSLFALLVVAAAAPAFAQAPAPPPAPRTSARPAPDTRLPIFAADARGMFASLGDDALTAANLYLTQPELKSKAFGLQFGAYLYPLRGQSVALGIGAETAIMRNSFETINAATLKPTGTIYDRRLQATSGQVSLNFGKRRGWSYLTVGYGPMTFDSYLAKFEPDGLSDNGLNYGGGARWFTYDHLAFTVDLRFYATPPSTATANTAARARRTVFVMSAGVSLK